MSKATWDDFLVKASQYRLFVNNRNALVAPSSDEVVALQTMRVAFEALENWERAYYRDTGASVGITRIGCAYGEGRFGS